MVKDVKFARKLINYDTVFLKNAKVKTGKSALLQNKITARRATFNS